jgi:hydroxymethylglutaryl-CoA synthase
MSHGILAVGAYAPDLRIAAEEFAEAWGRFEGAGIAEKAVPEADEDALTMGYEAAKRALSAGGFSPADVDFLAFATTTPPVEEEDLTVRLGSFLGVSADATRQQFGGSTRAGTRALVAALDAAPGVGLVVAADCPRGHPEDAHEQAAGAGAAAFVIGPDAPVAVEARSEYADPYPGTRFRERGSTAVESIDVRGYDRQAFSEVLAGAVSQLDLDGVTAAAVQASDGKLPYRAAGVLGLDTEVIQTCATVGELGDTGAASVPLSLARALEDGHERVLAAAWGSGAGADALLLSGGEAPCDLALTGDEYLTYPAYLRRKGDIADGEVVGGGAYVPMPAWRGSIPQRHRLEAGGCPECGALAFPPEGACRECGSLVEYDPVTLPGTGTVEAATHIGSGGAPPEFAPLQARAGGFGVAVVAFDGPAGGTVSAPAQVVPGGSVAVGDRVRGTVRRLYTQEGVTRYALKVEASANA